VDGEHQPIRRGWWAIYTAGRTGELTWAEKDDGRSGGRRCEIGFSRSGSMRGEVRNSIL
jgi:hypothetical protein